MPPSGLGIPSLRDVSVILTTSADDGMYVLASHYNADPREGRPAGYLTPRQQCGDLKAISLIGTELAIGVPVLTLGPSPDAMEQGVADVMMLCHSTGSKVEGGRQGPPNPEDAINILTSLDAPHPVTHPISA